MQHLVYTIDPHGFVDRRGNAEKDRTVWIRPAPDCMATVTALLPVAEGVAVYASLKKAADTAYSDSRSGKQIMADTFVERITGQTQAHLVPVQINLTMTTDALLGNGTTPAWLDDFGPVSAEHARGIIAGNPAGDPSDSSGTPGDPPTAQGEQPRTPGQSPAEVDPRSDRRGSGPPPTDSGGQDQDSDPAIADQQTARERQRAKAWILRILTDPITGIATNIDSRRRTFDGNARTFLAIRDRICRQPFCSAPIRHIDHINPVRRDGKTRIDNGQGLCERGNYVKELPGWKTSKGGQPGEVITTTPTGHSYRTMPPPQVGLPQRTELLPRAD